MFRRRLTRKRILQMMYRRSAALAKIIREDSYTPPKKVHPHTQGMYDELQRWINILEGREEWE